MNTVVLGDCLATLRKIPDSSIDVLTCDPPYSWKFMGKNWDKAVPGVEIWKECMRVLKPGGFAFVMSGPRQDGLERMISNLRDAGFKVDFTSLFWTHANGFPKIHNISKAIDKKMGQREKSSELKREKSTFPTRAKEIRVSTMRHGRIGTT